MAIKQTNKQFQFMQVVCYFILPFFFFPYFLPFEVLTINYMVGHNHGILV